MILIRFLLGRDRARVWNDFHLSYIRPGLDLLCAIADFFEHGDNVCVHLAAADETAVVAPR